MAIPEPEFQKAAVVEAHESFRFGEFELDEERGTLARRGLPLEIRATPLRLLRYLVRQPGRVIPKQEIFQQVWRDTPVSDAALSSALKQIRRLLGDEGARSIRTLRGRGICFDAPVERRVRRAGGVVEGAATSPLVGREPVLDRVKGALDAAVGGRGGTLVLAGEAGIGKTRIAQEGVFLARAAGFQVYETWCEEGGESPAYWPWTRLMRAHLDTADTASLTAALGPGLADLLRLVPELRTRLAAAVCDTLPPPGAQFRLQDGIARFAAVLSRRRPLLLLFEDMHWADLPSLRVVQFMAREAASAAILVLATYRSEELAGNAPLLDTLAGLARSPRHEAVDVRGLGLEEVAELQQLLAPGVPALSPRALWTRSGGNPLYVKELLRLVGDRGTLPKSGSLAPEEIPPAVEAVLARRVRRLSRATRELLGAAALIGTRFEPTLVCAVMGCERAELAELLEEATRAGILSRSRASAGSYAFSHELLRDVVRAGLPVGSRTELHARIAAALQRLRPGDPQALSDVALHALAAARGGGSATEALEHASGAAQVARARLAYEEAAGQLENALEALDLTGCRDDDRRCDLLLALAEARAWISPFEAVRETARRAVELARGLGDAERLARAVDAYVSEPLLTFADFESIQLLEEAVEALGPHDSLLRVRLLALLATHLRAAGEVERSEKALREARERARRVADPALTAFVLKARARFSWEDGTPDLLLELGTELVECAEAAHLPETALEGQLVRLHALVDMGDLAGADREFAAAAHRIESSRLLRHEWLLPAYRSCRAQLEGRFAEAEQLAAESLRLHSRAGCPTAGALLFACQLYNIRRDQGRLAEVEPLLREAGRSVGEANQSVFRIGFARVLAELGRLEEARIEFERVAMGGFESLQRQPGWLILFAQLGEVSATLGDAERAARLYELLLPRADQNLLIEIHAVWGPVSLVLGRLAAVCKRWEEAEAHFSNATSRAVAMGARPLRARVQLEHARMLLARGSRRDLERVRVLLREALAGARSLGMSSLVRNAESLLGSFDDEAWPS